MTTPLFRRYAWTFALAAPLLMASSAMAQAGLHLGSQRPSAFHAPGAGGVAGFNTPGMKTGMGASANGYKINLGPAPTAPMMKLVTGASAPTNSGYPASSGYPGTGFGLGRPIGGIGGMLSGNNALGTTTQLRVAGTQLSSVIVGLQHARKLLAQTNHDYDGRRTEALNQVSEALRALMPSRPQAGPSVSTVKAPSFGQGNAQASQAASDTQMRQALQLLQTASQTLQNTAGQAQGAQIAGDHIQQAIADVEGALRGR